MGPYLVMFIWISLTINWAYAGTAANVKGGVGAVGDFVPIIFQFVDIIRYKEPVTDHIKIHNEMGGSESVDYQCDFLDGNKRTTLPPGDSAVINLSRKYGESWTACCKFFRTTTNQIIPPTEYRVDRYLHIGRLDKGGRVRHVFIRPTGIDMTEPPWESWPSTKVFEKTRNLAAWGSTGGFGTCSNPKTSIELLPSHSGKNCLSECVVTAEGKPAWCYLSSLHGWDYCTAKTSYDIRNNAYNRVLTTRGIPCSTACILTEGRSYYSCQTIQSYNANARASQKIYGWDYCSPRQGMDYYGKECTKTCGYYGENYRWCYVANSWGYCS